jgi:hypothetical protein
MTQALPRIAAVSAVSDTALHVSWKGGGEDVIELAGWIARGSPILEPLKEPALFRKPGLTDYDAVVFWGDENGDLGIDAYHLSLLAEEQRAFEAVDLAAWQVEMAVSDEEAADLLRTSFGQFKAWKAGTAVVPSQVAMLCRAMARDPLLVQAHYQRGRDWLTSGAA